MNMCAGELVTSTCGLACEISAVQPYYGCNRKPKLEPYYSVHNKNVPLVLRSLMTTLPIEITDQTVQKPHAPKTYFFTTAS